MLNSTALHQSDRVASSSISDSSSSSSVGNNNHHSHHIPQPDSLPQHADLKNYLIEKLLNEDEPGNTIKVDNFLTNKSGSKEDLISETGTYTIEEKASDILTSNKQGDKKSDKSSVDIKGDANNISAFKSIDLMSARAAIDETFGIIDRPSILESSNESLQNSPPNSKRPTHKMVRERNLTYSLTHDLVVSLNQQLESQNNNTEEQHSLTKATTYDIIPNALSPGAEEANTMTNVTDSVDLDNTVTSQVSSTKSEVNTEVLLGNTEQLIESIKKRRSDKKQMLQQRLENANNSMKNNSKHTLSPSSSSCSSSTTMSLENSKDLRSWTIPTNDTLEIDQPSTIPSPRATVRKNEKKNISSNSEDEDLQSIHLQSQKRGNGGMAFDILSSDNEKNGNNPVIPDLQRATNRLSSANLARHRSATRNKEMDSSFNSEYTNRSSNSSNTSKTVNSSRSNHASITRKVSGRRVSKSDDVESCMTVNSGYTSAKSGTSLGGRIQAKSSNANPSQSVTASSNRTPVRRRASDNSMQPTVSSFNSSTTSNNTNNNNSNNNLASPYTNRTLFLRQQSAKAKRESLVSENNKKPVNGILKKNTNTSVSRTPQKSSSRQPSRANSRNTSPYSCNSQNTPAHQSALMTGSLNLPSGSALPGSAHSDQKASYQRRKNYDPIKAVEMEKQNKLMRKQSTPLQTSNSRNSIYSNENESHRSNIDYDSMSDSSSFSIPLQSLKASMSNKQSYERILQSTLQRLCIRLIQMSTGVLDKIGDENSTSESTLFNSIENSSELERMQQLAKLVHSMQLVHDHIQIIDTSLSQHKPEESYMKELSKIRQEVECLKQNAANSANSSVVSNGV